MRLSIRWQAATVQLHGVAIALHRTARPASFCPPCSRVASFWPLPLPIVAPLLPRHHRRVPPSSASAPPYLSGFGLVETLSAPPAGIYSHARGGCLAWLFAVATIFGAYYLLHSRRVPLGPTHAFILSGRKPRAKTYGEGGQDRLRSPDCASCARCAPLLFCRLPPSCLPSLFALHLASLGLLSWWGGDSCALFLLVILIHDISRFLSSSACVPPMLVIGYNTW